MGNPDKRAKRAKEKQKQTRKIKQNIDENKNLAELNEVTDETLALFKIIPNEIEIYDAVPLLTHFLISTHEIDKLPVKAAYLYAFYLQYCATGENGLTDLELSLAVSNILNDDEFLDIIYNVEMSYEQ